MFRALLRKEPLPLPKGELLLDDLSLDDVPAVYIGGGGGSTSICRDIVGASGTSGGLSSWVEGSMRAFEGASFGMTEDFCRVSPCVLGRLELELDPDSQRRRR
jgi:hypothetical protein